MHPTIAALYYIIRLYYNIPILQHTYPTTYGTHGWCYARKYASTSITIHLHHYTTTPYASISITIHLHLHHHTPTSPYTYTYITIQHLHHHTPTSPYTYITIHLHHHTFTSPYTYITIHLHHHTPKPTSLNNTYITIQQHTQHAEGAIRGISINAYPYHCMPPSLYR